MKIILLSPAHPLRGGIAASSERLALELLRQGHEVVIYSFKLQYPGFLFPGKSQFTTDPPPPGLMIKTRLNSINPFNWLLAGREMARENADRIIVRFWLPFMGPCTGTVLRVARRLSRKKITVTALVDNIIPHEKRPGDRPFAQYFVNACDDFVVMSKSVGEEIRGFLTPTPTSSTPPPTPPPKGRGAWPQSTSGIPNRGKWMEREQAPLPFGGGDRGGVDTGSGFGLIRFAPHPIYDTYGPPADPETSRQQLDIPPDIPAVLFFGFIRAYKGLDLLLQALPECPEVHALIAGECYEDWQPYQEIIDRFGLADRVHLFTDFIPATEVARYFAAADLVVQPYRSATQSGISQIAYHFEKPMVVTNVGGLPEIVTDGVSGYVVAPEPQAIAAAIRDFFGQRRAAAMQAGVRREKARFSWENLVRALLGEN